MSVIPDKNYVFGRGELWLDRFADGTRVPSGDLRYLGNSPGFTISAEATNLDHYDIDRGARVKDDTMLLELNRTGTLTLDDVQPENLAMLFLGTASVRSQEAASDLTYDIPNAKIGYGYQIGQTAARPEGVRDFANVVVNAGGSALVAGTDYRVDAATGLLVPITEAAEGALTVTYDLLARTYQRVVSGSSSGVSGFLRYVSYNPKGRRMDFWMPYVTLTPNGDFNIKSDEDWVNMPFSIEVLKLDDQTEALYGEERGVEVA